MTLILGMSKPEGIYLSADFRVTQSGRVVDDSSVKLITVLFPPPENGTRGLLAFTGLAILPNGLPVGTWLAETIRGESEFPDQLMAHLKSRLDRDLAPEGAAFILNVLLIEGVEGQRRLFGGFTNLKRSDDGQIHVLPRFEYVMQELHTPFVFFNGSGSTPLVADRLLDLARSQLGVHPRRAHDHMKLLSAINRRVSAKDRTVSPACHVAFIPAKRPQPGVSDTRFGPASQTFTQRGERAPIILPTILFGIDTSALMLHAMEDMAALKAGTSPPAVIDMEEMNRRLRRRD